MNVEGSELRNRFDSSLSTESLRWNSSTMAT